MKGKPIQNLPASVYARLLKRTELGDEDFQFVPMRYGAERLMYRIHIRRKSVTEASWDAPAFLLRLGRGQLAAGEKHDAN